MFIFFKCPWNGAFLGFGTRIEEGSGYSLALEIRNTKYNHNLPPTFRWYISAPSPCSLWNCGCSHTRKAWLAYELLEEEEKEEQ